jgi:hypothetical protein
MSLAEGLLQGLSCWRPEGGRQILEITDPEAGWAVTVTAEQVEFLPCRLWEVTLRHRGNPARIPDLAAWAERVASRVTGLLEPLRALEVDADQGVGLLRSVTPGRWGAGLFYYEILLEAGAASVRRYQAPGPGQARRRQVLFTLTHEPLAQLVRDLTA